MTSDPASTVGEAVEVYAAGSLRGALTEVAAAFRERNATPVRLEFAPSGLLRQRIERDAHPHLFASADLGHPQALADAGIGGAVTVFAHTRLCLLTRAGLDANGDVLDLLLDDSLRLGTSTPGADPSGDYAWQLFEKAERLRPGSFAHLCRKARQLTGGPDSPHPPDERNPYAWVLTAGLADIFLTYTTNALAARSDTPDLNIMELRAELAVAADYGLTLMTPEEPNAVALVRFLRSDAGQAILAHHGFDAPA
jgi:ABC-type molybdate transport system substrate-binding protein